MKDTFVFQYGDRGLLKISPGERGGVKVEFVFPMEIGGNAYGKIGPELLSSDAGFAARALLGGDCFVRYKFSVGDSVYYLDRKIIEASVIAVRVIVHRYGHEVRYLLNGGERHWSWKFFGQKRLYREGELFASKEDLKKML